MKLITHNMLSSKCLKGVLTGYPLKIVANEVKKTTVEFNGEFIQRMITKIDYNVLREAASNLGADDLPAEPPTNVSDEDIIKKVHHALMEIEVIDGDLICPETGRKFPIKKGIPNMLVNEDEI